MIDRLLITEMAMTEAARRFGLIPEELKDFYDVRDFYYEVVGEIEQSLVDDEGDKSSNIDNPKYWTY